MRPAAGLDVVGEFIVWPRKGSGGSRHQWWSGLLRAGSGRKERDQTECFSGKVSDQVSLGRMGAFGKNPFLERADFLLACINPRPE